uniref:hypothetical protein n=1 Tax=Escherichia coli TaxID=562 RepID=UPI0020774DFC
MKLYEFKNIKIDLVLTEDIIPEDKLQEIIQSDDIIKLARKKTYEHLLRARRKSKELKTESRKKIARKMILMRERIRKNNKIKLDKEVNQSIKWVKDIQAIELVLMQDIMNKIHLSLTNALHSLDTSSRINWDDLLNEVVRETLSNNNIVGAIKITKNPDIKLDPGEANNIPCSYTNLTLPAITLLGCFRLPPSIHKQVTRLGGESSAVSQLEVTGYTECR